MLIKAGVDISRLKKEMRVALNVCDMVLRQHEIEVTVTSTFEGTHSAGSLHYAHQAVDIRSESITGDIVDEFRQQLSNNYDVVDEGSHIHIEYDP